MTSFSHGGYGSVGSVTVTAAPSSKNSVASLSRLGRVACICNGVREVRLQKSCQLTSSNAAGFRI